MLNICQELEIIPWVRVVENGFEAAVSELATRDLTLLERVALVERISQEMASAENALGSGKLSVAVEEWFALKLGKIRGYRSRKIEYYLKLARLTIAQKASVADHATPESALEMLGLKERQRNRVMRSAQTVEHDDSLPVQIERLVTSLDELGPLDDGTKDLLRMLQVSLNDLLN